MGMNNKNYRFLLSMFLFTVIWCLVSSMAFYLCFPVFYFVFYPLLPFYFYLFAAVICCILYTLRDRKLNMTMLFLGLKMLRLLISVIILAVCCWLFRQSAIELAIAFMINYLVYLGIDIKIWQHTQSTVASMLLKEVKDGTVY